MQRKRGHDYNGTYYSHRVEDVGVSSELVRQVREYFDIRLDIKFIPSLKTWGLFIKHTPREMRLRQIPVYGNGIDPVYLLCSKTNIVDERLLGLLKQNDPWRFKTSEQYYQHTEYQEQLEEEKLRKFRRETLIQTGRENRGRIKKLREKMGSYLEARRNPVKFAKAIKAISKEKNKPKPMFYKKQGV